MSNHKTCSRCKQLLPIEQFRLNHKNKDGRTYPCRDCLNAHYKEYRKRVPRKPQPPKTAANMTPEQIERKREYRRNYYQNNKVKHNESRKKYLAKNAGLNAAYVVSYRLKQRGNSVYKIELRELKKLRLRPCFYCGKANSGTVDHVIPISLGGQHSIGNLVPACQSCNSRKQKKLLIQWRIQKGELARFKKTT